MFIRKTLCVFSIIACVYDVYFQYYSLFLDTVAARNSSHVCLSNTLRLGILRTIVPFLRSPSTWGCIYPVTLVILVTWHTLLLLGTDDNAPII